MNLSPKNEIQISFFRSMRGKLILLFLAVALIPLSIAGTVALVQFNKAEAAIEEMGHHYLPRVIKIHQVETAMWHISEAQKDYIVVSDETIKNNLEQEIEEKRQNLAATLAEFEATLETGPETASFQALQTSLDTFLEINDEILLLSQNNNHEAAQALSASKGREALEEVAASIERIEEANGTQAEGAEEAAHEAAQTGTIVMFGVMAAAAIIVVVVAFFVANSLAGPLLAVAQVAQKLALGDVGQTLQIKKRDEIGLMVDAFNQMTANLRNLIGQVQQGAGQVANASQQLNTAAAQSGLASQQVTNTIQQVAQGAAQQTQVITEATGNVEQMARAAEGIARGAQEQAQEVQKTSALVDEMAEIVDQVDQVTQAVSQATGKVTQAARRGVSTVQQTGQGIDLIRTRALTTADKVKEMSIRSKEIGRIVEAIDDIADKTDMLALNAAVEAARAGEHGRGFAVVAEQVRKLSEDSKVATRDIGELIERVQESVREATGAMESTVTEVANGARLSEETAQSLTEILQVAEEATSLADRIDEAVTQLRQKSGGVVRAMEVVSAVVEENTAVAEEMAASSQQVTEAVAGVVTIAEENSASAEEVSASAEEMSAQVEEVVAASQELSLLAEHLKLAMSQFRVEESYSASPRSTNRSGESLSTPAEYPSFGTVPGGWQTNGHTHKNGLELEETQRRH